MKTCPKCKANVSDTAKFCVKCGFNIKKFEEENANKEYFCAECGTKFSGGSFCPECGYNISADVSLDNGADADAVSVAPIDTGAVVASLDLGAMSSMAQEQLYEKDGFVVENGILTGYNGKKRIVTIPGTIEEIFDGAFENNDVITFVEIGEGVRIIGKRAFANCSSLVKINIPVSIEKIYEDTFEGTKLENLLLTEYDQSLLNKFISKQAKDYLSGENNLDRYRTTCNGSLIFNVLELEKDAEDAKAKADAKRADDLRKAEQAKKAEEKRKAEEEHQKLLASWSVGKTNCLGTYNKQSIEWVVLERKGNKALILSKYVLDAMRYNEIYCGITWASSTLRRWLNNNFLSISFDSKDRSKIIATTVLNPNNQRYGTSGGETTTDFVFLLSEEEVAKYKSLNIMECTATDYAKSHKPETSYYGKVLWWLRSPGERQNQAMCFGDYSSYGSVTGNLGVRPAMWIDLDL